MKRLIYTCGIVLSTIVAYAKEIKYPVSAIPEGLKQNMSVVIREDETIFKINSRKSSSVHFHLVATILNPNGKDYATSVIHYDKMRKVKDLTAVVYNAAGESIKKLKSSDILDRAASGGDALFSDDRLKAFDLTQSQYPYTVEVEYDMEYDHLYSIDGSALSSREDVSVQHFKYQLIYPIDLKPRYRLTNIDQKPTVNSVSSNVESLTWTFENVAPAKREPMAPVSKYIRKIDAAPNNFEIGGYSGDMSSWENFGKWFIKINESRDKLPEEAKRKVHELTAGLKANEEKARAIYEYMQSKTRYVGIQLGIGGLQPFEATTVEQTGYGDCKALSNYMVAMLKEAGINAYYTMIYAGDRNYGIDPAFPSGHANHIIVAVPNERDTTWLECTSQTIPYGFIGSHTDNRYGLMVTENGGKLRKTTYYSADKNIQSTVADVTLDISGNARAQVVTNYSGLQYENNGLSFMLSNSSEEQKKWIQENTQIPTFDVSQFSMTNKKDKIPTATIKMNLSLNKYASVSNKRIFLTPNLMNKSTFVPEKVENRKTPFLLSMGYTDIDTIKYHLPESMYPEFLPPDSKFTSRFGTYESGFKLDQGSLIYFRRMMRKDGEFPAEAYQELIDFYKSVNKADNTKLVFLSKT